MMAEELDDVFGMPGCKNTSQAGGVYHWLKSVQKVTRDADRLRRVVRGIVASCVVVGSPSITISRWWSRACRPHGDVWVEVTRWQTEDIDSTSVLCADPYRRSWSLMHAGDGPTRSIIDASSYRSARISQTPRNFVYMLLVAVAPLCTSGFVDDVMFARN